MRLRAATSQDAAAISEIYAPYVSASNVSFEKEPPTPHEMQARMEAGRDLYPWLVLEDEAGDIAGYAYATTFRARAAYRFAVETSVYLSPRHQGLGLGRRLYQALLATLEAQGFTQAIAAIALPNSPSVRLHEAVGFVATGRYAQIGYKLGDWHDVGLWQRALAPATNPPTEPRKLAELEPIPL